ncbi:transcription factor Opi1-domain-containing protein [Gaertneriomyces semiglobifer]|nr:transcription factor Opi1-domain-containing protein [Gaertneriomyces semiglobifer]
MDPNHNGHSPGSELGPPLTAALSSPLNHSSVNDRAVVERGDMSTAPHIPRTPRSSSFSLTSVRNSVSQLSRYMFSEETLRGLRYCLEWLQYASAHIERQVQALMTYISSLASFNSANTSPTPPLSPNGQLTLPPPSLLSTIKREVVETIRRVVDVVGRYAAIYLPAEGRGRVRGFILGLPGRWASLSGGSGRPQHGMLEVPHLASSSTTDTSSTVPSPTTMSSPTNGTNGNGNGMMVMGADMEHLEAEAKKVLALANESGNMVKGVERVFRSTVENLVPPPQTQTQSQSSVSASSSGSVSAFNGPPQPLEDDLSPCATTATTTSSVVSNVGGHTSGGMDHTREEDSVDDEARKRRRKGKSSG